MANSQSYTLTFGERIQALSGFKASSGDTSFNGTKNQDLTTQWIKEGIRESINLAPPQLSERTKTYYSFESSPTGVELQTIESDISNVTLHNNSKRIECRPIKASQKGRLEDSDDILYATSTDPVYYLEADKINVLPYGYECSYAGYNYYSSALNDNQLMAVSYNSNDVPKLPPELQDLVILYASIRATEHLLAIEEDTELYFPIISNLKDEYKNKVTILQTGAIPELQQKQR